jgi:hypothetical protein
MSKPEIIITGLGHAGSTYLMNIFDELGLDVGEDGQLFDENRRHGREYAPAVNIHRRVTNTLSKTRHRPYVTILDPSKVFDPNIKRNFKEEIGNHHFPQVIKSPNTGWTWFIDLFEPKFVIVCYSNPLGWMASMLRWSRKNTPNEVPTDIEVLKAHINIFGSTVSSLEYHEIDYSIIDFPKSVESAEYLSNQLRPCLNILKLDISDSEIYEAFNKVVFP